MYVEYCSIGKGFLRAPSLSLKGIITMWCHTSSTKSAQTDFAGSLGIGLYDAPIPYSTPLHKPKGNGHVQRCSGYLASPRASLSLCGTATWLWVNTYPHKTSTSETIRSAVLVLYRIDPSNVPTYPKYLKQKDKKIK